MLISDYICDLRERCERDCLFLCQLSFADYPSRQIDDFSAKHMLLPAGIALAEDPAGTSDYLMKTLRVVSTYTLRREARRGRDTSFFPEEAEAMPTGQELL